MFDQSRLQLVFQDISYEYNKLKEVYIYKLSLMYSRHLQYSEPAMRARELCLIENEQKDIVISTLKAELFPLRNLEIEFLQLNDQIRILEERYSLLNGERDRAEREQRSKSDLDRTTIIQMRADIDNLRGHLQRLAMDIDECLRENSAMKRMCEARANEIQGLLGQQRDLDNKNQRQLQQNKGLGMNIKAFKDERKKLEDDCDALSGLLEQGINKLKVLERNIRNVQSTNARLQKTLNQAQNDHNKLQVEYKQKSDQMRRAQNKDKQMGMAQEELRGTFNILINQLDKNKAEADIAESGLQNQLARGKELLSKISVVEVGIREREEQLDKVGWEQNKLKNQHMQRIEDNRILNSEIDRLLAIINQYQLVNQQLLDEIEIYVEQDMQAISILDRRDQMREVIQKTLVKVNTTRQPVKHLKSHFNH